MKRATSSSGGVDTAHYTPEIIDMMDKATHCLTCGSDLKYSKNKDKRRNRGYCSLDCYYKKSPKFAYAEKVHGIPIDELILELLNQNNNVQATADLLGVSKPILYNYIHKHNIERIVVWKGSSNHDKKTIEENTFDSELIKERCAKELSPFKHRRP